MELKQQFQLLHVQHYQAKWFFTAVIANVAGNWAASSPQEKINWGDQRPKSNLTTTTNREGDDCTLQRPKMRYILFE